MVVSVELVKAIAEYILADENKEEIVAELKRYKKEFSMVTDYNWYRYGNILPYYSQIENFYKKNNLIPPEDNEELEKHFIFHVGKAIDSILRGEV